MSLENFINTLKNLFRIDLIKEEQDTLEFLFLEKIPIYLKRKDFEITNQKLKKYNTDYKTEIYNKNNYEVLLGFDSSKPFQLFISNKLDDINIIKDDPLNGISYIISKPSNQFLLFFLENLSNSFDSKNYKILLNNSNRLKYLFEKGKSISVFYLLKEVLPRFLTLKIISVSNRKQNEFSNFGFSMLFNYSFNTDFSIFCIHSIEEFMKNITIHKYNKINLDEIDAPRRLYNNELVFYYQEALKTSSPEYEYISYYRILECFFDNVYYEDLTTSVRNTLTLPSFSYKRLKDIRDLIQKIQKKITLKTEDYFQKEAEILALTIKKFFPEPLELKILLFEKDESSIDYYKENEVSFSKGDKVDLTSMDFENTYKNLSLRLWKTKNSITIKREYIKQKYSPIYNSHELPREIILLRTIAEKAIIESSKEF